MFYLRSAIAAALAATLIACSSGSATGPELPVGPLVDARLVCTPTNGQTGTVTASAVGFFRVLDGTLVERPLTLPESTWVGSGSVSPQPISITDNRATFAVQETGIATISQSVLLFDENLGRSSDTATTASCQSSVEFPGVTAYRISVFENGVATNAQNATVALDENAAFGLTAFTRNADSGNLEPVGFPNGCEYDLAISGTSCSITNALGVATNRINANVPALNFACRTEGNFSITASIAAGSECDAEVAGTNVNNIALNEGLLTTGRPDDDIIDRFPVVCVIRTDNLAETPSNRSQADITSCPTADSPPEPIFLGSSAFYMAIVQDPDTNLAYHVARPLDDSGALPWNSRKLDLDGNVIADDVDPQCNLTDAGNTIENNEIQPRQFLGPIISADTVATCPQYQAQVTVGDFPVTSSGFGARSVTDERLLPPAPLLLPKADVADIAICQLDNGETECTSSDPIGANPFISDVDYTLTALCRFQGGNTNNFFPCSLNGTQLDAQWAASCDGIDGGIIPDRFSISSTQLPIANSGSSSCNVTLTVRNRTFDFDAIATAADDDGDDPTDQLTDQETLVFSPAPVVDFKVTPEHACVGRFGLLQSLAAGSQINGTTGLSIESVVRRDPFCVGDDEACASDSTDAIDTLLWAGANADVEIIPGYWDGDKCDVSLNSGAVAEGFNLINTGAAPAIVAADCGTLDEEQCYEASSILRVNSYCVRAVVPANAATGQQRVERGATITVLPVVDERLFDSSNALCEALGPALESDVLGAAGVGPQLINLVGSVADPILTQLNTVGGQFPDINGDGLPDGALDTVVDFLLFGVEDSFPFGLSTVTSFLLGNGPQQLQDLLPEGVPSGLNLSTLLLNPLAGCVVSPVLTGVELLLDGLLGGLGGGNTDNVPDADEVGEGCVSAGQDILNLFTGNN